MQSTTFIKARGFTLAEVLVGLFLSSLLLTILVRTASLGYRVGHEEINRAALEEQATLMTAQFERDVLSTASPGITLASDGNRIALNPIDTLASNGRKLYSNRLTMWSHGHVNIDGTEKNVLIRSQITDHPSISAVDLGEPIRLLPEDLDALPVGGGQFRVNVYQGVETFSVKSEPSLAPSQVGAYLTVSVELVLLKAGAKQSIRSERLITFRTSGF